MVDIWNDTCFASKRPRVGFFLSKEKISGKKETLEKSLANSNVYETFGFGMPKNQKFFVREKRISPGPPSLFQANILFINSGIE